MGSRLHHRGVYIWESQFVELKAYAKEHKTNITALIRKAVHQRLREFEAGNTALVYKTHPGEAMVKLTIRLNQDKYLELMTYAASKRSRTSSIIRTIIDTYISRGFR